MIQLRREDIKNNKLTFISDIQCMPGVKRVANYVKKDVEAVFGEKVDDIVDITKVCGTIILYGTLGNSPYIDQAIAENKLNVADIEGKNECYKFAELVNITEKIEKALVIVGSDKRGTIYGLFHLSELLGVSPLVNWCDIKPAHKEAVDITDSMLITSKEPSVKYRGFFINDEWPAFGNWVTRHFGDINRKAYEPIFELLLRLKGNYLWPAMWSGRFSVDGPGLESAILADEMGVVMGMSHHEPCLRHGEEYKYVRGPESIYGDAWDFNRNREGITRFWEDGLKRSGKFENVITVGMRGEADSTILGRDATLKDNIDLLRDVLQTQNRLIRENVCEDLTQVPRMLALYKEVEPFFYGDESTEGLMDSPELEGVTLMLCDDNHGNLRTLPTEHMREHKGGYGMYYHFDYHGWPISYEWVNSSSIYKTWEQMTTAYEFGIRDLWIVNVGDIFSTEYPLSFFLDLAYDYDKWGISNLNSAKEYTQRFVDNNLGAFFSEDDKNELCKLLKGYTHIAHNRRPEAMNDDVYAPMAYGERERLYAECENLMSRASALRARCDEISDFPYFELVYYPLMANMNVQCLWLDTTYNHYLASIGATYANVIAKKIEERLDFDEQLVEELHTIHGGKWFGMGLSEHIGFRRWNEEECRNPVAHTFRPSHKARLITVLANTGECTEGDFWAKVRLYAKDLLNPDNDTVKIRLYATSDKDADFKITSDNDWCICDRYSGTVKGNSFEEVNITYKGERPASKTSALFKIYSGIKDSEAEVEVLYEPVDEVAYNDTTFIMTGDYISIDAGNFSRKTAYEGADFTELVDFGKMKSGMKVLPVINTFVGTDAPCIEYDFTVKEAGEYIVDMYMAPTNPVYKDNKLMYGIAVEDKLQIINTIPDDFKIVDANPFWEKGALSNIRVNSSKVSCKEGLNTLKIYAQSPGLVIEKIVIHKELCKLQESYLGPTETYRR